MSDDATHPPSADRLKQARKAGDTPISGLACTIAALVAGGVAIASRASAVAKGLERFGLRAWSLSATPAELSREAVGLIVPPLTLVGASALAAALLVGLIQTRGLFNPALLFRRRVVARVGLPSRWLFVFGILAYAWVEGIKLSVTRALFAVASVSLLVAVADGIAATFAHVRRNRLTRRELIAEAREDEVDPELRAELRRRAS